MYVIDEVGIDGLPFGSKVFNLTSNDALATRADGQFE
jgi:hypothetical protein